MLLNKKNGKRLFIPLKLKNWVNHSINREIEISIYGYKAHLNMIVQKVQEHEFLPLDDKIFINIGAGSFYHKHWINIDKISDFYTDSQDSNTINWDLLSLSPLPFPDSSIDLIYTSHLIEHVSDEAVRNLFSQAFMKMKEGGGLRIVCPDMEYLFDGYKRGDKAIFFPIRDYGKKRHVTRHEYFSLPIIEGASIQQLFLWAFARQASIYHNKAIKPLTDEEVDNLFSNNPLVEAFDICVQRCSLLVQGERPEEHINWWTESKVTSFLKEAGFSTVIKSRCGQSIFSEMRDTRYFDTNSPGVSLYIEAVK